jgi:hypothetical protein
MNASSASLVFATVAYSAPSLGISLASSFVAKETVGRFEAEDLEPL